MDGGWLWTVARNVLHADLLLCMRCTIATDKKMVVNASSVIFLRIGVKKSMVRWDSTKTTKEKGLKWTRNTWQIEKPQKIGIHSLLDANGIRLDFVWNFVIFHHCFCSWIWFDRTLILIALIPIVVYWLPISHVICAYLRVDVHNSRMIKQSMNLCDPIQIHL